MVIEMQQKESIQTQTKPNDSKNNRAGLLFIFDMLQESLTESPKLQTLYKRYRYTPDVLSGHLLAVELARKYEKGFKTLKKRGPAQKKWTYDRARDLHTLVWIKTLTLKCSKNQAIFEAAKEMGLVKEKKGASSIKSRYYELQKNDERIKKLNQDLEREKENKVFLETLKNFYKNKYG